MEADIRYYRRRACEEMSAASRAVTPAARQRRLYLVGLYLDHLKALNEPAPFDELKFAGMMDGLGGHPTLSPAFGWAAQQIESEHA